jgi:two-component system sensor histidine kinase UhpB
MTRPSASNPPLPDPADLRQKLLQLGEQQRRLVSQLQSGEQQFRQLARSVWRVQEDERRRLARELHDGIGQHLTALRHRLDGLMAAGVGASDSLQQAVQLCDLAIGETRALSRLLRPQILDDLGLEAALRWLGRQTAESIGCQVEVAVSGLPDPLDGDLSTLIFRVAQEALTNAAKHAQAPNIVIRVSRRGPQLQLLIVDDGRGCDVEVAWSMSSSGQSTGLASMRERVRLFGGQLSLVSPPGEGVQLRVLLPLATGEGV